MKTANSETTSGGLFPVRIVALRSGLTPDLLRAWERRYKVVQLQRSAGRQRLYSEADVELLTLLRRAVESGRPISQVASLDAGALRTLIDERARKSALANTPPSAAIVTESGDSVIATALEAVVRFDADALSNVLRRAALLLGVDEMLDGVLGPLLFTIGSLWHQGVLRPANEHMASEVIRGTLTWMMEHSEPAPNAPTVVVGTPIGQVHELGAMLVAAAGAAARWRVVYLGANLPAADLIAAVKSTGATALALSIVYPIADPIVTAEFRDLHRALPEVAILAGGRAADQYEVVLREVGAVRPASLAALRAWFRARLAAA